MSQTVHYHCIWPNAINTICSQYYKHNQIWVLFTHISSWLAVHVIGDFIPVLNSDNDYYPTVLPSHSSKEDGCNANAAVLVADIKYWHSPLFCWWNLFGTWGDNSIHLKIIMINLLLLYYYNGKIRRTFKWVLHPVKALITSNVSSYA